MNRRRPVAAASSDRGAVLVEFALALPFLLLFLFGIVEFGAAYSQNLDVRHGAREGGRLAAVNYNPFSEAPTAQTNTIVATVCQRMDETTNATVDIEYKVSGATDIGDVITISVEREYQQITGFLDYALKGVTLSSSVDMRLEQAGTFDGTVGAVSC